MDNILKFLIRNLRTLGGTRGNADKILKVINKEGIQDYLIKNKR